MGHPVMRFQILSKDPARAAEFYSSLFGWTAATAGPFGERGLATGAGRGIDGQIWPSPPEGHAFVQLFIEVDVVAAVVARATATGARVLFPPQRLPQGEEVAILLDPEGTSFGIYSSVPG